MFARKLITKTLLMIKPTRPKVNENNKIKILKIENVVIKYELFVTAKLVTYDKEVIIIDVVPMMFASNAF
jgi:hypothetical protein